MNVLLRVLFELHDKITPPLGKLRVECNIQRLYDGVSVRKL